MVSSRILSFAGAISYSVYLLHGIVLCVITQKVNRIVPMQSTSAATVGP